MRYTLLTILSFTFICTTKTEIVSMMCANGCNFDMGDDDVKECYDDLFYFVQRDNKFEETNVVDLKFPYASMNPVTFGNTAEFMTKDFYHQNKEEKSLKQEFFDSIMFWYETIVKPVPEGDLNKKKAVSSKKVALKLFLLGALNGIYYSELNNHALINSCIKNAPNSQAYQPSEWNFPTSFILSEDVRTSFNFVNNIDNSAIKVLLDSKSYHYDDYTHNVLFEDDKIINLTITDHQTQFGMYRFDNYICPVELFSNSFDNIVGNSKFNGTRIFNVASNGEFDASKQRSPAKKYSLFGYFGGYNNKFNGVERNTCTHNGLCDSIASLDIYSNINQIENIAEQKKDNYLSPKDVNEVFMVNLAASNPNKDKAATISQAHDEITAASILPSLWTINNDECKLAQKNKAGQLGSISVRVRDNTESLKYLLDSADMLVDHLENNQNPKPEIKQLIFKLLASENVNQRRMLAHSLLKHVDEPAYNNYISNLQSLILQEEEAAKASSNDFPAFNKDIYSEIKGNKEKFSNFLNDKENAYFFNNIIQTAFELELNIIKALLNEDKTVYEENFNISEYQEIDCKKEFGKYKAASLYLDFDSSYSNQQLKRIFGITIKSSLDSIRFNIDYIHHYLRDLKRYDDKYPSSDEIDFYLKALIFWVQNATLDYIVDYYDTEGEKFSDILVNLNIDDAKNYNGFISSFMNFFNGKSKLLEKYSNKFLARFNSCVFEEVNTKLLI